jgi:hypothetical protein
MHFNWNDFQRVGWEDELWRDVRETCLRTKNLPATGSDERFWLDCKPTRKMLLEMVSILDGMERLTSLAEKEILQENPVLANWITSIRGLQRRMTRSLEKVGVKSIPSVGRPFDAHLHEAVEIRSGDAVPPATVLEVIEKPYKWGNQVLRVGKVVVSPKTPRLATSPDEEFVE